MVKRNFIFFVLFISLFVVSYFIFSFSDEDKTSDWLSYGNEYNEQHFSHLNQINIKNVNNLKLDWELPLPDAIQLGSTPLAIDGKIYFTGDRAIVYAVDGRTGQLIWVYDPKIGEKSPRKIALGWNSNRGLAYLDGKLFLGATDGRLIALNKDSGKLIWSVDTFEKNGDRAITGAPRAFKDTVIIGHGGADAQARGYVSAYDANTGEFKWRFYLVPGNPSKGFENAWKWLPKRGMATGGTEAAAAEQSGMP